MALVWPKRANITIHNANNVSVPLIKELKNTRASHLGRKDFYQRQFFDSSLFPASAGNLKQSYKSLSSTVHPLAACNAITIVLWMNNQAPSKRAPIIQFLFDLILSLLFTPSHSFSFLFPHLSNFSRRQPFRTRATHERPASRLTKWLFLLLISCRWQGKFYRKKANNRPNTVRRIPATIFPPTCESI